jgi:hypothetical protein
MFVMEIFIGVHNGKYIMNTALPYPDDDFLPYEYQFSSQHREDGIIDLLCARIPDPDYRAIEIGSGNGEQNMIRNLIENRGYHGIGHDLQPARWQHDKYEHRIQAVNLDELGALVESWPTRTPDFFSLDIDSFDFWVLKDLLYNHDFRPAVMCLEYLSYFRNQIASVRPDLGKYKLAALGCSLGAYQQLTERFGYRFFTVDTCGVNGFFYLPSRLANPAQLDELPRHAWRMYPRYAKHIIATDNPAMEFDPTVLFENNKS